MYKDLSKEGLKKKIKRTVSMILSTALVFVLIHETAPHLMARAEEPEEPIVLTISGVTVEGKEYDGTTTVTSWNSDSIVISGFIDDDTEECIEYTLGTPTFADAAAEENKTITFQGFALNDNFDGKYTLSAPSLTATITQKEATLSWSADSFVYDGNEKAPTATVSNLIDGDECDVTVTVEGEHTNVGNGYVATAASIDNSNYTLPAENTHTFSITNADMSGNVSASGYSGTYDKAAHGITVTAPDGATVTYGTVDGTYTLDASPTYTDVGSYTVYYKIERTNYADVTGSQTVSITAKTVGLDWSEDSFTYDGTEKCPTATATELEDGDTCTVTVEGGQTAVGNSYTATATSLDNGNYTLPAEVTHTFSITNGDMSGSIIATGYSGTYDKVAHGITVTAPDGATVTYGTVDGTYTLDASPTYTDVGSYTVYYKIERTNYADVTGSQTVSITAKTVGLDWSEDSFTYDGTEKCPTATATELEDGDTCTVTVTGGQTAVGNNYTATATSLDNGNYTLPAEVTHTFSITGANMSEDVSADGYEDVYDKTAHGITVTAPEGATVTYGTVSGTYTEDSSPEYTNVGTYTVYYKVSKANYADVTGSETVVITAKTVGLNWTNTAFTYNGEEKCPTATATGLEAGDTCTVTVTGGQTNAGDYTATATLLSNSNYALPAVATQAFSIAKADQAVGAPELANATIDTITLEAIANGNYKCGDGEWQESPVFSGLEANETYTFYQMAVGDDNHNASEVSEGAAFSTTSHVHAWGNYTAEGATITATCENTDSGHIGSTEATLTIVAPTLTVFEGTGSPEATITGSIPGESAPQIVYKQGSTTLDAAPTDAGTYTANITLSGVTASVQYTIAGKDISSGTAITYDEASFEYGAAKVVPVATVKITATDTILTEGTDYDLQYVGVNDTEYEASATEPGLPGDYKVKAIFKGNYTGEKLSAYTFTISKTENPPTAMPQTITYNGSTYDLSNLFSFPFDEDVVGRTYSLVAQETTGTGAIDGNLLTITRSGQFTVKVVTAETATRASCEVNSVLTVQKKGLTVNADNKSKLAGADDPSFTYQVTGLVGSDTEETVLTGTLARAAGETAGTYSITQGTLAVTGGNYDITFGPGTLTITPNSDSETALSGDGGDDNTVTEVESANLDTFADTLVTSGTAVKVKLDVELLDPSTIDTDTEDDILSGASGLFVGFEESELKKAYIDIDVRKYTGATLEAIDTSGDGVTVPDTEIPIEIALTVGTPVTEKNPVVVRVHNDTTLRFTPLNAKPTGNYTDGTYYVDKTNGIVYVYSRYFSKYSLVYAGVTPCTVTFDSAGGSSVPTLSVKSGSTITSPANPTRSGYTFGGWLRNSAAFDFTTAITEDVTLTARWTAVSSGSSGSSSSGSGSNSSSGNTSANNTATDTNTNTSTSNAAATARPGAKVVKVPSTKDKDTVVSEITESEAGNTTSPEPEPLFEDKSKEKESDKSSVEVSVTGAEDEKVTDTANTSKGFFDISEVKLQGPVFVLIGSIAFAAVVLIVLLLVMIGKMKESPKGMYLN